MNELDIYCHKHVDTDQSVGFVTSHATTGSQTEYVSTYLHAKQHSCVLTIHTTVALFVAACLSMFRVPC